MADELARVILDAEDRWHTLDVDIREHPDLYIYITDAVRAHLASDAVVVRSALAAWRKEGGPAWETCGDNYIALARAIIAEASNGGQDG